MVSDWMLHLEKKEDEHAKYWLENERFKIELFSQSEENYYSD
jgi:hypothetical protein